MEIAEVLTRFESEFKLVKPAKQLQFFKDLIILVPVSLVEVAADSGAEPAIDPVAAILIPQLVSALQVPFNLVG
jgi:hypothetical protein